MILNNRIYDVLKWVAMVFLPAFITFLGVVLNSLNVANTEIILTIAIAFNTFLGSLLGISNINYRMKEDTDEEENEDEYVEKDYSDNVDNEDEVG